MAQAYSTFATGGVKRDAVVVTKIEDKNGNIIYEAADTSKRVLSEEVAGATTNVLKTVFTEGTARGASPSNGQTVAGKTGTSENYIDHWLVGYSPTLSCATWIGNPAGNIEGTSNITCNRLWHDFMSAALEDQPWSISLPPKTPITTTISIRSSRSPSETLILRMRRVWLA